MAEPGDFIVQKEAFNKLGALLHGLLSEGDERIELLVSVAGPVSGPSIRAFNPHGRFSTPDGQVNYVIGPYELHLATKELRAACYREDAGIWFSARIVVTAAGGATAEYNFDQEPDWGDAPVDDVAYLSDLEDFPRSEDKMPDWLKSKVAEARSR